VARRPVLRHELSSIPARERSVEPRVFSQHGVHVLPRRTRDGARRWLSCQSYKRSTVITFFEFHDVKWQRNAITLDYGYEDDFERSILPVQQFYDNPEPRFSFQLSCYSLGGVKSMRIAVL
jgi:hypothetical protein